MSLLFGIIFAAITLLAIGLQRTYDHYPVKELKRRARNGDPLANILYKPVSYGVSLRLFMWSVIVISSALAFVLLSKSLDGWFAIAIVAFLIWLGYLWIPSRNLNAISEKIAIYCTPFINWVLNYLYPLFDKIATFMRRNRYLSIKTNLYEKEDIYDLLDRQKDIEDNRISQHDITLLQHVLQFSDKYVRDVYVPMRVVQVIDTNEAIGPKLMDELYKSGYSRFPVFEDDKTNIVGTLYMKDLVHKKSKGHVRDVVRPEVFYVHEDFTLQQALQAFLKTKHHLFVVVNAFEEFVGIVTIEDIIEALIGKQIVDEFDTYESVRAVAQAAAKKEHVERLEIEAEPSADEPEKADSENTIKVVK